MNNSSLPSTSCELGRTSMEQTIILTHRVVCGLNEEICPHLTDEKMEAQVG